MTDERQGEGLWTALKRLPRGSGVVFRHYTLPEGERRDLLRKVSRICRQRRLLLVTSGNLPAADGWHGRGSPRNARGIHTAPCHDVREIRTAERAGADLLFVSPVFPTRSHPGARTLGRVRFGLLSGRTRLPVIALGGMDGRRARGLPGAYGWAGIDAWSGAGKPNSQRMPAR
jgi:thiamine-phosphate pyrophosphorylase